MGKTWESIGEQEKRKDGRKESGQARHFLTHSVNKF